MSMVNGGAQYALFKAAEHMPVDPVDSNAESVDRRFSDYVVYVDESGDHALASIDPG